MSKIKLTFDELSKVRGGVVYRTLLGFDEHQPYALVSFYGIVDILFNPSDKQQVDQIKKGNPTFYGIFYLNNENESNLKKYRVSEILGW